MSVATAGEAASSRIEHLRRVPGVDGVVCFEEEDGTVLMHDSLSWTASSAEKHSRAMCGLLSQSRCALRKLFEAEQVLHVSVRTRLKKEFLLAPDEQDASGLAILVVQQLDRPTSRPSAYSPTLQMLRSKSDNTDWLFGAADE